MNNIMVKIPASIANVGPGYDVFGIAISLYNSITLKKSDKFELNITGTKVDDTLPVDNNNLVVSSIEKFYNHINKPCPKFKITVDCQIPLASGLGSSSTAIAGGLASANKFEGSPLNTDELLTLAWEIEGHPDNVAPAILGGFVISAITAENELIYKKLLWPEEWKIIIAHPDFKLSTQKARAILPKQVDLKDAIFNMSCCAFLVSAICTRDSFSLKKALNDKLHQPYRATLIPGMIDIIEELKAIELLGTVLSGAGPSLCIITDKDNQYLISEKIKSIWQKEGLDCEFFYPEVDNSGIHYC